MKILRMIMQKSLKDKVTRSVTGEDCGIRPVKKKNGFFSVQNLLSPPLKGKGKVVPVLH
jgi:hypothetical protein